MPRGSLLALLRYCARQRTNDDRRPCFSRLGKPGGCQQRVGSYKIHTRNGAIDDEAASEQEAFAMARQFLSYLPSSADELPPLQECDDDPDRSDEALVSLVPKDPRQVYKMHTLLESVCDKGSFFEIGRKWGRSMITGLARFGGVPVAIFAENPRVYGGAWTADAARKLIRLLDLASTFHLPVIHLEDCPGFLIGKQSEEEATIRYGSAALAALGQCTTPFCCVVIRKAFGVAGAANHKPGSHHMRAAWPSGDWGSLPIEGGIEVAYKAEIAESDEPDEHLAKIKERLNGLRSRTALPNFSRLKKSSIQKPRVVIYAIGHSLRAKQCAPILQILATAHNNKRHRMSEYRQHSYQAPAGATEILLVRHGESRAASADNPSRWLTAMATRSCTRMANNRPCWLANDCAMRP